MPSSGRPRRSLPHGAESCPTTFAKLKIEQLRTKTLGFSEPTPVPPRTRDFSFFPVRLKKVLKNEIQNRREGRKTTITGGASPSFQTWLICRIILIRHFWQLKFVFRI